MNYLITVVNAEDAPKLEGLCQALELPGSVVLRGRGTAVKSMLDLLGIESTEKRILLAAASTEKTEIPG